MLWGENIAFWLFAACFVVSVGVILVLLERIRNQLNLALPSDGKVSLHPALPRSFGQLIWRTNLLAHSLELLDQYRKSYPSSCLPKILGIALMSSILSFIGFAASAAMT